MKYDVFRKFENFLDRVSGSVSYYIIGVLTIAFVLLITAGTLYWAKNSTSPVNYVKELNVKSVDTILYRGPGRGQSLKPHKRVSTPDEQFIIKHGFSVVASFENNKEIYMKEGFGYGSYKFVCTVQHEQEKCYKIR